jgi:hypothetical protein
MVRSPHLNLNLHVNMGPLRFQGVHVQVHVQVQETGKRTATRTDDSPPG